MERRYKRLKKHYRRHFETLAVNLVKKFGPRLTPELITWLGLLGHIPIVWLIMVDQHILAALLLVFFGLFDTLDGAVACVRKTASSAGMFLDASTDRLKEAMLYVSLIVYFIDTGKDWAAILFAIVLGLALSVSYVKAKGEAAVMSSGRKIDHRILNRLFDDGFGSFEVRMGVLVVCLLIGLPALAAIILFVLTAITLVQRFIKIKKALS